MNTTTRKAIATIALTFTVTVGLAACSTPSDVKPAPTATTAPATPAPAEPTTPTEAPVEVPAAPVTGAVITEEQADALPEGQTAYAIADGSLVVVSTTEPLPEAVRADITSELAAKTQSDHPDALDFSSISPIAKNIAKETGRNVLTVVPIYGVAPGDNSFDEYRMYVLLGVKNAAGSRDQAQVIAAAEQIIAADADPSSWDLIVID